MGDRDLRHRGANPPQPLGEAICPMTGQTPWPLAVGSYSCPTMDDDLPTPRSISCTGYRVHVWSRMRPR
jgi:hypothetical protein